MAALVDCASGADTAAIEALEAVAANLRRAADARARLAAHVPPEMLRQVLIARSIHPPGRSTRQRAAERSRRVAVMTTAIVHRHHYGHHRPDRRTAEPGLRDRPAHRRRARPCLGGGPGRPVPRRDRPRV